MSPINMSGSLIAMNVKYLSKSNRNKFTSEQDIYIMLILLIVALEFLRVISIVLEFISDFFKYKNTVTFIQTSPIIMTPITRYPKTINALEMSAFTEHNNSIIV